jgi:hypothetical protein
MSIDKIEDMLTEAVMDWKQREFRISTLSEPVRVFATSGKQMEARVNQRVQNLKADGRRVLKIDTQPVEHLGSLCFSVTIWHYDAAEDGVPA